MTREEAKEVFINRGYVNVKGGTIFDGDKWRQSVEVITEWLKEQPCADAISRQVAIDATYTCYIGGKEAVDKAPVNDLYAEGIYEAVCAVEDLPSVNTEKAGRWIKRESEIVLFECSVCKDGYIDQPTCMGKPMFKYCPTCGAKMEVAE